MYLLSPRCRWTFLDLPAVSVRQVQSGGGTAKHIHTCSVMDNDTSLEQLICVLLMKIYLRINIRYNHWTVVRTVFHIFVPLLLVCKFRNKLLVKNLQFQKVYKLENVFEILFLKHQNLEVAPKETKIGVLCCWHTICGTLSFACNALFGCEVGWILS